MITLFLLLVLTRTQPCSAPQSFITSTIIGVCSPDNSVDTYSYPLTISSGNEFTVSGWFQLDNKGTDKQGLFSVQQNGMRIGLVVHDEVVDFLYETQTVSKPFVYTVKRWFLAVATLSYSTGYVNFYVWLPMNDVRITQAPTLVGVNFNTPITSDAKLNIMYFNTNSIYCGRANNVLFYDGYYENDNNYNWMNLAFLGNSIENIFHFTFEDQIGQKVKGTQNNGYLGSTRGVDIGDPTPGQYIQLSSSQYVTLPSALLSSTHQSISFWYWSNIVVNTDAFVEPVGDTTKEAIIIRRVYGGSQDQFQILSTATAPYTIKLNYGSVKSPISLTPTVTGSTWTYISIASAYVDANLGISKIYYSAYVNGAIQTHTQSSLAIKYDESANDVIFVGDLKNAFTSGTMRLAHLDIRSGYVNYYSASTVKCKTSCLHSINSYTQQQCYKCSNFLQSGSCVASCVAGPTGYPSAILPLCRSCIYQCKECSSAAVCTSCNNGYYLQTSNCVLASNCNVGYLADPVSKTCTQCGDGVLQGAEQCDDGNFINGDGCTNCNIDSNYSCSGTPSHCQLKCGNSVLDAGEQCDIGQLFINGCINCQLEAGYYCTGTTCKLLCGDGKRVNEDCDDNNSVSNDGCSQCKVDFGYQCYGGSSTNKDTCSKQCSNGILDQTEQCDDNNSNNNDGCGYCRIQLGYQCTNNVCINLCGNGLIDDLEQCDDNNSLLGDGCSYCLIDYGYKCDQTLTQCESITTTCGDSYKSLNEQCEDGNLEVGDGCSETCQIESGFTCVQGLYRYSLSICYPTCGDGIKKDKEECDDGNVKDGDGCSRICKIETKCGNSIRESNEFCDDGNQIDMDGCTNCIPDPGYSCNLIEGGTVDKCNKCPENCDSCTSDGQQCLYCFNGYALYNYECYSNCPQSYYYNEICLACPENCLECYANVCTQCSMSTYLFKEQCIQQCTDGYFEQQNGVLGNSCIKCYAPCNICQNEVICDECDDGYRIEDGSCVSCNFDKNCIKCDVDNCLECQIGYQPDGQECVKIDPDCGDGLHALSEQCDDADLSGGCVNCKIKSGYNCILEQNEGPDICYELKPVEVSAYIDEIHFDKLYLEFNRPLSQIYNYTELLLINIPDLPDYQYEIKQVDLYIIEITFTYYDTVQHIYASLNFTQPNNIEDKFGWSLVGQANDSNSKIAKYGLIKTELNYYIYYTDDEVYFSDTLSYITLSFLILSLISAFSYSYKIGSGQVWQIIQSLQLISLLRLIKLRYSLHIDKVLDVLNYCNFSFIPNLFLLMIDVPKQNTIKFQIEDYPSQFLLNAGGRYISFIIYALVLWVAIKILIKLIHWEPIQNRLEDIDEYMKFQAFVRMYEMMFLDLMVSCVQTFQNYSTTFDIINIVLAAIFIILSIVAFVLAYRFILRHNDAYTFEWLHMYLSCLYDGYEIRTRFGRLFIYVPYIRKLIYACLFLLPSQFIQIIVLCALRIVIYFPLYKFNPFISRILLYKQTIQALFDTLCLVSGLMYLNIDDSKQIKVSDGWYMLMAILITIINYTLWNIVLIFVKVKSPNYLLDDFEIEEEPKFKNNQIVPMDYIPPEDGQNNPQIVPEGYEKPPDVGIAQIVPEKQPKDQDIISVSSNAQEANNVVQDPIEEKKRQEEERKRQEEEQRLKEKEERKQTYLERKATQKLKQQEEEKDELVDDFFG
ncbi:unnamed protein product [Paramecium octaurelia]|uniref:Insulin-like growth factor binding protein, N-terminal n=1 Tax=Paramecium octaurelia TaxID=43137 RepID=A0A8S1S0R4_PAROT|nr:unnamed protein product [Paramecium octaurelia]